MSANPGGGIKMTTFHRNLNATNGNKWSFNDGNGATQAKRIYANKVTVKQPSGKKFEQCLLGGNRAVFAWFKSKTVVIESAVPQLAQDAVRIRFNPKLGHKCFQTENGHRVDFMREVWCEANGECWAKI